MNDFLDKVKQEISSTLALDFDGVLHKNSKGYHNGTIYDDPLSGTKEALDFLSKKYRLVIYTCKLSPERPLVDGKNAEQMIWEWLKKHNIYQYISSMTYKKPRAALYIDDKAIRFDNWKDAIKDIEKFGNINGDLSKF